MRNAIASVAFAALLFAGCSGHGSLPSPGPAAPQGVKTIPLSDAEPDFTGNKVGIRLNGETSINDHRYGFILGYAKGYTTTTSQVINVSAGQQIKFKNVDASFTHTISFLGNARSGSAPWPPTFNGGSSASPAGTAIGTTSFSSGPLSPGAKSAVYSTGMPGFYMFGCAFHYNPYNMRTVIIVH